MAAPQKITFLITARNLTRRVFRSIRREINSLGGRIAAIFGAGTILAAGKNALEFANNIKTAASALNLTTTELQALRAYGKEFGIQADDVDDALHSINIAQDEARKGNDAMAQSLARLGMSNQFINARRGPLAGLAMVSAAAELAGENIENLSSDFARVFGEDVSRRLLPLLRQGPAGLVGGITQSLKEGMVAPAADIEKAAEAQREIQAKLIEINVQLVAGIARLSDAIETLNSWFPTWGREASPARRSNEGTISDPRGSGRYNDEAA